MAFSASHIEITLRYLVLGQRAQTARVYTWDGVAIAAATPHNLGEAWWNHYKTAWREIAPDDLEAAQFLSVFVREVGGGLAYGEYPIPTGEQAGLRDITGYGSVLPSANAMGNRLAVASGVTRPGQFRTPWLTAADIVGNSIGGEFQELGSEIADLYSQPNVLGPPVATGTIAPTVTRFGVDNNTVAASQPVVGFVINPFVTTQASRRYGHGT